MYHHTAGTCRQRPKTVCSYWSYIICIRLNSRGPSLELGLIHGSYAETFRGLLQVHIPDASACMGWGVGAKPQPALQRPCSVTLSGRQWRWW